MVLCLMNMVTKEELEDDEEYEGLRVCMSTCVYVQECMRRQGACNSITSTPECH